MKMAIEELPDLVINYICEHLSYQDLFRLRVTCKQLKEFVDRKVFRKVHVFVRQNPQYLNLFHTNREISHANSLRNDDFNIITAKFRNLFEHIQQLVIYFEPHTCENLEFSVHLNDLNHFESLRHFEVYAIHIDGRLILKNLEVALFSTPFLTFETSAFEMDCPRLKALGTGETAEPTLISDASDLVYLFHDISLHSKLRENYWTDLYSRAVNLSTVCFENLFLLAEFSAWLNGDGSRFFPPSQIKLQKFSGFGDSETVKKIAKELAVLKGKSITKRIDFLVNEQSLNLDQLLELLSIFNRPEIKQKICSLNFFSFFSVTNSHLKILMENRIYDCLFPLILSITIDEESDLNEEIILKLRKTGGLVFRNKFEIEEHLFELLLRTWRSVEKLAFENVHLKPEWLETMAEHFLNVKYLHFKDDKLGSFNFIGKFQNLVDLEFYFILERDALKLAYDGLKSEFSTITISLEKQTIFFRKSKKFSMKLWSISKYNTDEYFYFSKDLNRLLDFFYEKRPFEETWVPGDQELRERGL